MFFAKMSLRGKIASAIICSVLLAIIVTIGISIYKNVVKATEVSAKTDSYIIYEKDENTENTGKNEVKNEVVIIENKTAKNEIQDQDNKTYEKNETKDETKSESKNENIENKIADNTDTKKNEKQSDEQNEKPKEKTAATEGKKGVVYLTFDDGPSTNITPKILDILKSENVKATFFILNYNSEGEKIVKRAYAEGHSIGIHGYSHKYEEIYKTEEAYMNNLNCLQEKIENSIGFKSRITRFPGGSSNTITKKYNIGIMSRLVKKVEASGYKYYDWNVDSNDAGSAKTSAKVYSNVTKNLSKKRPNVVLMHDFANGKKTLNALRDIIRFAKSNGYVFEKITYDGNLVAHHNVNN